MLAPPICRRRGGTTLFRSASSDEDGGNPANIAASSSEQSNTARLREELNRGRCDVSRTLTGTSRGAQLSVRGLCLRCQTASRCVPGRAQLTRPVISTNRRLTSPAVPEMTLPGSIVRMGPLRA
jgi:hypothetical protein